MAFSFYKLTKLVLMNLEKMIRLIKFLMIDVVFLCLDFI